MRKLLSRDKYNKSAESYKIDYQIFEKKGGGGHLGPSITKISICRYIHWQIHVMESVGKAGVNVEDSRGL